MKAEKDCCHLEDWRDVNWKTGAIIGLKKIFLVITQDDPAPQLIKIVDNPRCAWAKKMRKRQKRHDDETSDARYHTGVRGRTRLCKNQQGSQLKARIGKSMTLPSMAYCALVKMHGTQIFYMKDLCLKTMSMVGRQALAIQSAGNRRT